MPIYRGSWGVTGWQSAGGNVPSLYTHKRASHCCYTKSYIRNSGQESASSSSGSTVKLPVASKSLMLDALSRVNNRGIFGVKAAERAQLDSLIKDVESQNPLQSPTEHLEEVAGSWRLLYSTIVITGSKRIKLGLKDVVSLGEFIQIIDTASSTAVNRIGFEFTALIKVEGALTVEATYEPVGPARVAIKFRKSTLVPPQLERLFQANYDLLLAVFNPEGWLDITYVDDQHRIGRDDKGNVFVLERF